MEHRPCAQRRVRETTDPRAIDIVSKDAKATAEIRKRIHADATGANAPGK